MHVVALSFELHVPTAQSLKDKRQAIRPILDGLRHRLGVSVAEVDYQDKWQRARIGVAVVGGDPTVLDEVAAEVDRFVWSFPEVTVTDSSRVWCDLDE